MRFIVKQDEDDADKIYIFAVTTKDTEDEGFRILAETELYSINAEDEEGLKFFFEELEDSI